MTLTCYNEQQRFSSRIILTINNLLASKLIRYVLYLAFTDISVSPKINCWFQSSNCLSLSPDSDFEASTCGILPPPQTGLSQAGRITGSDLLYNPSQTAILDEWSLSVSTFNIGIRFRVPTTKPLAFTSFNDQHLSALTIVLIREMTVGFLTPSELYWRPIAPQHAHNSINPAGGMNPQSGNLIFNIVTSTRICNVNAVADEFMQPRSAQFNKLGSFDSWRSVFDLNVVIRDATV
ncbi:hypothetical protein ABKN59_010918 [Abortiporus biennis]